jgi:serine/threonine-protein kinase
LLALIAAFAAALTLLPAYHASAQDAPALLWRFAPGQPDEAAIIEAPVVDGGSIFAVTTHGFDPGGDVVALDAATGEPIWHITIPEAIGAPPVFGDGVVYVGAGSLVSGRSAVYALDATTGDERWRVETPVNLSTAPAVAGGVYFVGLLSGELLALDADTGEEQWRAVGDVSGDDLGLGRPVVENGSVYITGNGTQGGTVLTLNAATGAERWRARVGDYSGTAPAVEGDMVYVGGDDGAVHALDAATGAERWRFSPDTSVHVPVDQNVAPVVAGGAVYVSDEIGALLAIGI